MKTPVLESFLIKLQVAYNRIPPVAASVSNSGIRSSYIITTLSKRLWKSISIHIQFWM